MLTNTVEPHASDIISEAWFYNATHFLTEIWDRRCWHQKGGIFYLIFSQKMGINILGGPLRKSNLQLRRGPLWVRTRSSRVPTRSAAFLLIALKTSH